MKKSLNVVLILVMIACSNAFSQESILGDVNAADIESYIALAKQNYAKRKVQLAMTESVKTGVAISKASYLDIFNASYIYRPEGKTVVDPVNPYNVNGFQLGVNVNIGALFQKPYQVKKAKADYKVAQLEALDFDNQLVVEVKKRYYDYIEQKAQLKILTQSAVDSKGVAESLRSKFEKGAVTLDVYNQSRITQANALTLKINAETNYLKVRDLLQEIIGQKLPQGK
ncbi:TolC family protein [Pedobacter sandarakinus]|uniref:TolC family protein n=1 Tax=Pedobacter sandarakinus TaxID=353156 RepID=UPI00224619D9|nr:TolC family protein [Pedobacter sandarakinus]MCX2574872.1 TolC family protein [Pedobacter sandarakinus]